MAPIVSTSLRVRDHAIHCKSCEERISRVVGRLGGVLSVRASSEDQTVTVVVETSRTPLDEIRTRLAKAGYPTVGPESSG